MPYRIEQKDISFVLYINRPEPGEGLKVMTKLRNAALEFLPKQPMAVSFLIELTKNVIDHADQGCVYIRRRSDGRISFQCVSWVLSGISEAERNKRRGQPNRSQGLRIITDLALDPECCILDVFQARCSLAHSTNKRSRPHFFSGCFKAPDG